MMIQHLLLFSILSLVPWTSTGFTLKLIHRDSPISPLYQSNFSDFERFVKNIEISKARASYLEQPSEVTDAHSIQLPSKFREPVFTVEIGIGTPAVKKTLIFDTGSGFTWTQCAPCIGCFKQNEPLFVSNRSTSYKALTKTHPLAKSKSIQCRVRKICSYSYNKSYVSGQSSTGVAATESFTFDINATVPNLVFGCGTRSSGIFSPHISGILGLNREPSSFAMQLGSVIKGRFSYCMSSQNNKGTYVTFGDKAVIQGEDWLHGADVAKRPLKLEGKQYTFKTLNDITLNGRKLNLGAAGFGKECYIDSGAPFSLLHKTAFSAVRAFLKRYFAGLKNFRPYVGNKAPKGFICYTETPKLTRLPQLHFNFEEGNFFVPDENLFIYIDNTTFCLAMAESKSVTVLGAYQQRNYRFLYDLKAMVLSFVKKDCSKDIP